MSLNIKNAETESLVRELARQTGESITEAVTEAVRERLARVRRPRPGRTEAEEILALCRQVAALPLLDSRPPEEILKYDDLGLPA